MSNDLYIINKSYNINFSLYIGMYILVPREMHTNMINLHWINLTILQSRKRAYKLYINMYIFYYQLSGLELK